MAQEMKVYDEITAFQAKVIMGMSWRQLLCAFLALLLGSGVYALLWLIGLDDWAVYGAAVVATPFGLMGWARPAGLPFEKYASFILRHLTEPQKRLYGQQPVWRTDRKKKDYGQKIVAVPSRPKQRFTERGR